MKLKRIGDHEIDYDRFKYRCIRCRAAKNALIVFVSIDCVPAENSIDKEYLTRQSNWSLRTFGPGYRISNVIAHIRKELKEIEAKPDDIEEWADLIMLSFDGAIRQGHDPQDIIEAVYSKLIKNELRTWPDWRTQDPNKVIEHDRTCE